MMIIWLFEREHQFDFVLFFFSNSNGEQGLT